MSQQGVLSVQLYSLRDQLAADQAATLSRLADIGFRHVEPFGLGARGATFVERMESVRRLRDDLDAAGLSASTTHASIPDDVEELARECNELGVDSVFVPHPASLPGGFGAETFADPAGVDAIAQTLSDSASKAAAHGLRVGYHNHWYEWAALPDGSSAFPRFWSATADEVLAEVDLYWAATAGADPAAVLDHLGDRVVSVHVKDGPAEAGEPQTPLGTGRVDIPTILTAAKPLRWHVAEIDTTEMDPFELLRINAEVLVDAGLSRW